MDKDVTRGALAPLSEALAAAGRDSRLRTVFFDALREAEKETSDRADFRSRVRYPIVQSLLADSKRHQVTLANGLIVEVGCDSRIEQALLLSSQAHPDHVWEPQTTKLLVAIGSEVSQVIVGGAYIGDQVLPIARAISSHDRSSTVTVHAFEPMVRAYEQLLRNVELNHLTNVVAHRLGLWDSTASLKISGPAALGASTTVINGPEQGEIVESIAIDDYVRNRRLPSLGLIMLDTEGGEEKALYGAREQLKKRPGEAPHLVFEVHRSYVDWSHGLRDTSIVDLVASNGYSVFAVRDFHDNYPMAGSPIEIIPVDCIYLEGPPHGFNVLATKDAGLVKRLGLQIVENVSPKLLVNKDPALHHPLTGLPGR